MEKQKSARDPEVADAVEVLEESKGFEPLEVLPPAVFETAAISLTLPTLLN